MTELEYMLAKSGVDISKIHVKTVSVEYPKICAGIAIGPQICIEGVLDCMGLTNRQDQAFVAEKVIFHDPATIVYWGDGTKTVVKSNNGDTFNPITGVALCYMKKALGNKARAFNDALREAGV